MQIPLAGGIMELSSVNCSWMAVVSDIMGGPSVGIIDSAAGSGSTEGWK
jgi:hypothetical protein